MSDRLALAHAIEDAGIERSKAEGVATAISQFVTGGVATKAELDAAKAELKADIAATRAELKTDIRASEASVRALLASETARLDTRIERLDATVKAQPNAIMLRLGTLMVVLTGIILAALRYFPPPHG
jgi:hypothetical protein